MIDFIRTISEQYLNEARSAPTAMQNLAMYEKYMAESYCERTLTELIQNADDCYSEKICVATDEEGNLYFANDGRPFTESDIESISRLGASKKIRGESIGYRGVGFKSTTSYSNDIIIWSNNVSFCFPKEKVAHILDMDLDSVPTVNIPLVVEPDELSERIIQKISDFQAKSYMTVFIFRNADYSIALKEVQEIELSSFLFLKHIRNITYNIPQKNYSIHLDKVDEGRIISIKAINETTGEQEEWKVVRDKECDLAFSCDKQVYNGVFHSFLPTLDATGLGVRINSDFFTDPSRKHLSYDSGNINKIEKVADYIAQFVIKNEKWSWGQILDTIYKGMVDCNVQNKASSVLLSRIESKLRDTKWINTINENLIAARDATVLPLWFINEVSISDIKKIIRPDLHNNIVIEFNKYKNELLNRLSSSFRYKDSILLDAFVASNPCRLSVDESTARKVFLKGLDSYLEASAKSESNHFNFKYEDKIISIEEYAKTKIELLIEDSEKYNTRNARKWLRNIFKTTSSDANPILERKKKMLTRWQGAEELCVEIEMRDGWNAKNVSSQNLGYDVLSEKDGNKKYIEVKSIQHPGEDFVLTNNEYGMATLYKDDYYICLIIQGKNPTAIYIKNPLENAQMERRVKAWEWVLSNYTGEVMKL